MISSSELIELLQPTLLVNYIDGMLLQDLKGLGKLMGMIWTEVASTTLLVYDYLLTFRQEVSLIWPSPWTPVKVLFLLTRYMPFIDTVLILYHDHELQHHTEICSITNKTIGWLFIAGMAIAEVILMIRTWAVWDRNPLVLIGLALFFIATWAGICIVMVIFLRTVQFTPLPFPGCYITGANPIFFLDWVLLMVFETGIFILMSIKGFTAFRRHGNSGLFLAVFRDGILYYFYLSIISIVNVALILTLPQAYSIILPFFERVMHSILTARVLLGLREQASKNKHNFEGDTVRLDVTTASLPRFVARDRPDFADRDFLPLDEDINDVRDAIPQYRP